MVLMALSLGVSSAVGDPIRIGITPAILHDQYPVMLAFRQYVETRMGRPVELVPRSSYRQIIDMVRRGELDFAWVSAFPYVYLRHYFHIRLVAMPVLNGRPTFRAYLIVPVEDLTTDSVLQLKDKVFAYADPYSHTGYVVPRYDLLRDGKDARTFFARTFFTSGHKNVIRAVASGLADAGSVDSFVWDSLAVVEPQLVAKTRIAARSAEFGSPPIVAGRNVSDSDLARMRGILVDMTQNIDGNRVLRQMQMEGFVAGDPRGFDAVEEMMRATGDL